MTALHHLLAWLVHVALLPLFALRPKLRAGWWQRFYWSMAPLPGLASGPDAPLRVWAHGASAGDVLCLQPLLDEIARARPLQLTVTALTNTGVAMARQRFASARVLYQPYDLPGATRRAVTALQPGLLLLERAELWPALIRRAHAAGARVVVVNGRISPSLVHHYRRLFAITGPVLDDVDLFLMRNHDEADRMLALGARPERVHITGNTKLDAAVQGPDPGSVQVLGQELGMAPGDPVVVAGSTHRGEEELVLDAFVQARVSNPTARLVLAPRYLDRSDEVLALIQQRTTDVARRSAGGDDLQHAGVVLLDSLGELGRVYGLARVAFVGGSLVPRGGQNMLEPASQGVAVLVGPHTWDSRDQVELLRGRGLQEISDTPTLADALQHLLAHPSVALALGDEARRAASEGRGASQRCTAQILSMLDGENRRTA